MNNYSKKYQSASNIKPINKLARLVFLARVNNEREIIAAEDPNECLLQIYTLGQLECFMAYKDSF